MLLIRSERTTVNIYCLVPELDGNGTPRIGPSRASGHSACAPTPPTTHLLTEASVHPMAVSLSLITTDGGIKLELGSQVSSLCGSRLKKKNRMRLHDKVILKYSNVKKSSQ